MLNVFSISWNNLSSWFSLIAPNITLVLSLSYPALITPGSSIDAEMNIIPCAMFSSLMYFFNISTLPIPFWSVITTVLSPTMFIFSVKIFSVSYPFTRITTTSWTSKFSEDVFADVTFTVLSPPVLSIILIPSFLIFSMCASYGSTKLTSLPGDSIAFASIQPIAPAPKIVIFNLSLPFKLILLDIF